MTRLSWLTNFVRLPLFRYGIVRTLRALKIPIAPVTLLMFVVTAIAVVPFATPPVYWLPEAGDNETFLGTLLAAQAAVAALTLAVTLFVMQGVNNKPDADDRTYREYFRRSWVRFIFWGSLIAVLVTGIILLTDLFVGEIESAPGIRNLVIMAAVAFLANLLLAGALFERAMHLAHPEQWRTLKRLVNERDVREAIQVFVSRNQRAAASLEANQPDITAVFPDPGEGSADEAVKALLDDARRAMAERRQGEFTKSLDSIKELVTYAMDEIEKTDIGWSIPGQQPQWPPLRELGRNLYPIREEVIQEGNRDYVFELLRLDSWLASTGIQRLCGELFTAGLNGYRRNYQIANRPDSGKFRELLRDRFSLSAKSLIHGVVPEKGFPFIGEMVANQARMMSDAMEAGRPGDYERLHRGFEEWLDFLHFTWNVRRQPLLEETELYERLRQGYRIALMTLAGRATFLAQMGRIADADLYLDVARTVYSGPRQLADDIARAIGYDNSFTDFLWFEWDMEENEGSYGVRSSSPGQYPLTFFCMRLLELSGNITEPLVLRGNAKRVLDWFADNSERLANYLPDDPSMNRKQRQEAAIDVLRAAVGTDEIERDREIIGYALSEERVSEFKSDVYAAAFAENSVERLFEHAGAFLYLDSNAEGGPEELYFQGAESKGFFAEIPESARNRWARLGYNRWGRSLSTDVIRLLCEAADEAPLVSTSLDSPGALLQAINQAIEELAPSGELVAVLAGDWGGFQTALNANEPEGYEPAWRTPEADRAGEIGRYRGHAILRGPSFDERSVYIVEPRTWGCFVRAQCEGDQDLHIDVAPVSAERARKLLDDNPSHFPNEPDEESKLRQLQTLVEIVVGARHGFRVSDPSRARRIAGTEQTALAKEEGKHKAPED